MDNLESFREHMENFISNPSKIEPLDRVLQFPSAPAAAAVTRDGKGALDLVNQAAEVVKRIEDRANETERHARSIAERAIDKLQFAEQRIRELEAERAAAEVCINEARVMIREVAEALTTERARAKAAEDQLRHLELRASVAEAHAKESENTVIRLEAAIRTQLLGQSHLASEKPAAAA